MAEQEPRETVSPEGRRLRTSDVRMIVGIPSLLVLLTIAMGVANYWVYLDLSDHVARLAPEVDTTLFQRRILTILLIFVFLAATSGGVLVYTVLRPLRALTEAVNRMAHGRLHEPVDLPAGMFEVDQLGKTFNTMVGFINTFIEEREDILSEWSQGGSMIVSDEGRITSINEEGLRLLGAEEKQLAGATLDDVSRDHPDLAPRLISYARDAVAAREGRDRSELRTGGSEDKPLNVSCSPLHDHGHGARAFLIHFHDAGLVRSLNRLFSRTDHLAALGTFTVGLSHELRNPLATLKGNAQLLGIQVGPDSPYDTYVQRMVREIDRLDRLVGELYDFSRIPVEHNEPFDLIEMTRRVLNEVRQGTDPAAIAGIEVKEEFSDRLPRAYGQSERIYRAVRNLIENAFQHMPSDGTLTLRAPAPEASAPDKVVLEVANTGSTIPPENRQRVFEPFFSTRPGGTGLGLAIAYQIVAQNHGTLEVQCNGDTVCMRMALPTRDTANARDHGKDGTDEQ